MLPEADTPDPGSEVVLLSLQPNNGTIIFPDAYGVSTLVDESAIDDRDMDESVSGYVNQFHPLLYAGNAIPEKATSVCLLKKDGTWDLVRFVTEIEDSSCDMSEWTLHYDDEQYARTVDGHLRARMTYKDKTSLGTVAYKIRYFVVDYLPQTVKLGYEFIETPSAQSTYATTYPVRIYFGDTEGVERIVLEKLRQGSRTPTRIQIRNPKVGYYDTTIDRTTTFTAYSYNPNGSSISLPIVITPISATSVAMEFTLRDNCIYVESEDGIDGTDYDYSIMSLDLAKSNAQQSGTTNGIIDVSGLADGYYMITVTERVSGQRNSFKFRK